MANKEELLARLQEEKPAMEVRDLSFESASPKGVVRRSRGSSLCGLMMLRSASLKSIVSILSLLQMVNLVMIQIWPHLWYNGLWRKEYYLFLQWI